MDAPAAPPAALSAASCVLSAARRNAARSCAASAMFCRLNASILASRCRARLIEDAVPVTGRARKTNPDSTGASTPAAAARTGGSGESAGPWGESTAARLNAPTSSAPSASRLGVVSRITGSASLADDASVSLLVWIVGGHHGLQRFEFVHATTGPQRHAIQRRGRDDHRHAGLAAQPVVEATQQRAAAGQHDAAV